MENTSNSTMDIFIKLVREMRCKQQSYFANRTQMTLIQAKAAERTVDGWLKHFSEIKYFENKISQPELLNNKKE